MFDYSPAQWHDFFLLTTLIVCPLVFISVMLVPASYGRHNKGKEGPKFWGPGIPTRLSWVIMELPSSLGFAVIFFMGDRSLEIVPLLFLLMWQAHYFHRTFIFPFTIKTKPGQTTPLLIPLASVVTNMIVSFLNASILSWTAIRGDYDLAWLTDPRFIAGVLIFALGWYINRKADAMLAALRKPGESGYKIPRGWLYEKVSCPNYLGEFIIWTGWSIATWSWAGAAFVLVTVANLLPRALQNHRWYHEKFDDYPAERKAVFPYIL